MLAGRGADAGGLDVTSAALDAAPTGALDVDALLDRLAPRSAGGAARGAALVLFADPIQRAALAALRASGPRATAVVDALGTGQGEFLPFVRPGETGPAAEAARAIAAALAPSVVPLARNPDPAIRTKAIVLVARSADDAATDAIVAALQDSNEAVQRVAIAAVGAPRQGGHAVPGDERAVAALAAILATHESWALRILAAQALGRVGAAGAKSAGPHLADAAAKDSYALVRQAALEALASFDPAAARVVAQRLAATDPEPRVREAATALAR
jgi:cellulose synthase operon protein C